MGLLVAGIKALRDFLEGKAFFQVETDSGSAAAPGGVRRVRFMRDPS